MDPTTKANPNLLSGALVLYNQDGLKSASPDDVEPVFKM